MAEKKVVITITSGCRAAGKSLTAGKAYSLSAEDAKLVVSAQRGVYGDTTKKAKKAAK